MTKMGATLIHSNVLLEIQPAQDTQDATTPTLESTIGPKAGYVSLPSASLSGSNGTFGSRHLVRNKSNVDDDHDALLPKRPLWS